MPRSPASACSAAIGGIPAIAFARSSSHPRWASASSPVARPSHGRVLGRRERGDAAVPRVRRGCVGEQRDVPAQPDGAAAGRSELRDPRVRPHGERGRVLHGDDAGVLAQPREGRGRHVEPELDRLVVEAERQARGGVVRAGEQRAHLRVAERHVRERGEHEPVRPGRSRLGRVPLDAVGRRPRDARVYGHPPGGRVHRRPDDVAPLGRVERDAGAGGREHDDGVGPGGGGAVDQRGDAVDVGRAVLAQGRDRVRDQPGERSGRGNHAAHATGPVSPPRGSRRGCHAPSRASTAAGDRTSSIAIALAPSTAASAPVRAVTMRRYCVASGSERR